MHQESFEQQPLARFTEQAYLDYAMYVILDRALPSIADGLKPVQRRIVYAMSELGLKASAKHKKSARTVGDVLGKFHPHGDSACYEAMVLMAQPFSYRYPLIDGQGNWGSIDDPKSFAAMRYTEARLTPYAQCLLQELGQGTCTWAPNFDGTLKEPTLLPARLPNVLLNGASGIAVGMATDIPPHNLNEVVQALAHLIDHPQATLDELLERMPGPDFPTGGECITHAQDLRTLYETGRGSLKLRATYRVDEEAIVIDSLPYQVSASKVMQQIAQQMQAKKLPMLDDLRDESDQDHPVRLVLTLRSKRADSQALMQHLFATTELERALRVNLNVIDLDRKPGVMGLKALLATWLSFREQTLIKRLQFRLDQVLARLHILEGLLIIYAHLDEVIATIRHSDNPSQALMERFGLSEAQAEAILAIRLRQLAKLEELALRQESQSLQGEQQELEKRLGSPRALKKCLKEELIDDAERYGDARRTALVEREEARSLDVMPPANEPVTVVLSQQGWLRCAKGHDIDATQLTYKSGDHCFMACQGRSNQWLLLLDQQGRSYSLRPNDLPSARGLGDPVTKYLKNPAPIERMLLASEQTRVLVMKDSGYGLIIPAKALHTKNKAGRQSLTVEAGAHLLPPLCHTEENLTLNVALCTAQGRLLVVSLNDLPLLEKGKGHKAINITSDAFKNQQDRVTAMALIHEGQSLKILSGRRHMTLTPELLRGYQGERGRRGQKLPRGFQQVSELIAVDTQAAS